MPTLTRRVMIGGAAAALATPAITLAGGPITVDEIAWHLDAAEDLSAGSRADLFRSSGQQQLEACFDQLKTILARMHPLAGTPSQWIRSDEDGGFYVTLRANPTYREFDTDGFYMVSLDGSLIPCWLQEIFTKTPSGKIVNRHFWGYQWIENDFVGGERYFAEPRYIGQPNIISKLDMPEGMTQDDVPFELARS